MRKRETWQDELQRAIAEERNSVCYDLDGTISPQDNAQAVCRRYIKDGDKVFSVISRFDDLLTLADKEGHEPGDTLQLVVPFLIEAGVTEDNIRAVSAEAGLVPGIKELFDRLRKDGSLVYIISTSYEQHAFSIAERVGVPVGYVFSTKFQLNLFQNEIVKRDLRLISEIREKVAGLYRKDLDSGASDEAILKLLNPFYREELPKTKFGQMVARVEVMGGRRKVKALEIVMGPHFLDNAFVVGDSITDFRMAQVVEAAGGIAVAWNANWFLIPCASCGVAATDARAVQPLFQAWRERGRPAVRELVESAPPPGNSETGPYYHWLAGRGKQFQLEILTIHQRLRRVSRGAETAKLG